MTRPRVEICDATLSDGARGVGCAMTRTQRTELLHQLARLPFAAIELGWPACDETAAWLAEAAAIELAAMPVVALRPGDVGATLRATEAFAAIRFHLHDRRATLDELDRAIAELHDAGRDDIGILVGDEERIPALRDLGVTRIVLDDRAGALTPPELAAIAPDLDGVRCRGDLGLATANTLAAIAAGVHEVHGTVGGIGERAGLCALDEVMTVLAYKPEIYGAAIQVELRTLADVARRIARVLGRRLPITKPFLGDGVFATSLERHELYVRPEDFGRRRKPTPARVLRDALPAVHHDDLADFERWLLARGVDVRPDDVVACYAQYQRESSGRDEVTVPARRSALVIE